MSSPPTAALGCRPRSCGGRPHLCDLMTRADQQIPLPMNKVPARTVHPSRAGTWTAVTTRTRWRTIGRERQGVPLRLPPPIFLSMTCTTGDAVLRAAVVHAVLALGEYKVWSAGRRTGRSRESEKDNVNVPAVFVAGQRPRRSVRLLLALSRGAWVVSDSWLLASVGSRAWKPCGDFVPAAFPRVAAARTAYATGESLVRGMRVGFGGGLHIEAREFVQLVEGAGGVFGNRDASVIVLGSAYSPEARVRVGSAQYVNQRWLPHSTSRWALQPYSAYVAE